MGNFFSGKLIVPASLRIALYSHRYHPPSLGTSLVTPMYQVLLANTSNLLFILAGDVCVPKCMMKVKLSVNSSSQPS